MIRITQISSVKLIVFLLFTLLFQHFSSAQITVVDFQAIPIAHVELISNNRKFYAVTNAEGSVEQKKLENLNTKDTLVFKHYFYQPLELAYKDMEPGDTIHLNERVFEFEEVTIGTARKEPKYERLSVCYRGYQYNDDSFSYYKEGKADYVSKIKKDKYRRYIKESRSFSNEQLVAEIPHHSVGVSFSANIPYPPYRFLPNKYGGDNQLIYHQVDSFKFEIFNKDSVRIGAYKRVGELVEWVVTDVNFIRSYNLFNSEIQRLKRDVILVFRYEEGLDVQAVNDFENLLYYKDIREIKPSTIKTRSLFLFYK